MTIFPKLKLIIFLKYKFILMLCFAIAIIGVTIVGDLPTKFSNIVGVTYICIWNYIAYYSVKNSNEYRLFVTANSISPLEPYTLSNVLTALLPDVVVNMLIILAVFRKLGVF